MPAVRARACTECLDLALAAWLPDVEHGDPGLRHRHRHRLAGRGRADRLRLALAVLLRARLLGFVLRDLRLRHRQWQLARRRGEIELARDEHRESAAMLDAAGNPAGLVPGAEIEIGARRADDRRAGVLRARQAADRRIRLRALDRQVALDEERRAVFVHAVDRDGAARRQRHALRADRLAVVGEAGVFWATLSLVRLLPRLAHATPPNFGCDTRSHPPASVVRYAHSKDRHPVLLPMRAHWAAFQ